MEISGRKGVYLILTFKFAIIIFGAIILGVGLHSHYKSSWLSHDITREKLNISESEADKVMYNHTSLKLYEICDMPIMLTWNWVSPEMETCPEVKKEQFFIYVIVLTFAFSVAGMLLLWSRMVDMDMYCLQVLDVGFHGLSCLFLFVAGILYIHSANAIIIFSTMEKDNKAFKVNLLTQEKIAAGAFAIMQSVLYGLVAALTFHRLLKF